MNNIVYGYKYAFFYTGLIIVTQKRGNQYIKWLDSCN